MKYLSILSLLVLSHFELVAVITIGASGARSPINDMPPREVYEEGLNELTPIGVRQQYLLGYYHSATWAKLFLD